MYTLHEPVALPKSVLLLPLLPQKLKLSTFISLYSALFFATKRRRKPDEMKLRLL